MLMSQLSIHLPFSHLLLSSLILLPTFSAALRVVPTSKCASVCGPDINETTTDEVACYDSDFSSTSNGNKFRECVECELESTVVDHENSVSDVLWGVYNLRYAVSTCVWGYPEAKTALSTPCQVTCSSLAPAVEFDLQNVSDAQEASLGFCNQLAWSDTIVNNCVFCYNWTTTERYMSNFLQALHNACKVTLTAGDPFPIAATQIFSSTQISAPPSSTATATHHGLGSKLIIAIAVPTVVGLIIILTVVICCGLLVRKRRRMMRAAGNMDRLHAGSWDDPNIINIYGHQAAYPSSPPAWSKDNPSAPTWGGWNHVLSPISRHKKDSYRDKTPPSNFEGWGSTFSPGSSPPVQTQTWPTPHTRFTDETLVPDDDYKNAQLHERYFGQPPVHNLNSSTPPSTTTTNPTHPFSFSRQHTQEYIQKFSEHQQHPNDLGIQVPSPTALKHSHPATANPHVYDFGTGITRPRGALEYQLQPYSDQSPDKDPDSAVTDDHTAAHTTGPDGRRQTFIWDAETGGWVKEDEQQQHHGSADAYHHDPSDQQHDHAL